MREASEAESGDEVAEVEGRIERLGVYRGKRREKAMSSIQHCMRGLRGRSLTR